MFRELSTHELLLNSKNKVLNQGPVWLPYRTYGSVWKPIPLPCFLPKAHFENEALSFIPKM